MEFYDQLREKQLKETKEKLFEKRQLLAQSAYIVEVQLRALREEQAFIEKQIEDMEKMA